jgi:hypothetical protein
MKWITLKWIRNCLEHKLKELRDSSVRSLADGKEVDAKFCKKD